jgi:spermidine/putrescine transport system ATP-binding protein
MTDANNDDGPAIELRSVSKLFGEVVAVDAVDLVIRRGEFFSLLGPSGCGKTTTLRMLAGFEFPDAGTILLEGRDVSNVPANKRPVNMVFQRYELFPHMTVAQNVGYGLRMAKVPKAEIRERVSAMLDVVGVAGLEKRRADQLSGGQQQRVALARALVNRPRVLLLDEPLSALDVKLRKHMQLELKSIQHELGTTFVYVTHDQEEALLMSDRIGVMAEGRLLQVGSPREMYERPAHPFVADFVGTLNELSFAVDSAGDGRWVARFGDDDVIHLPVGFEGSLGKRVRAGVRPERVVLCDALAGTATGTRLAGVVGDVAYVGAVLRYTVDTKAGTFEVQVPSAGEDVQRRPGDEVTVAWPDDALLVLGSDAAAEPAGEQEGDDG